MLFKCLVVKETKGSLPAFSQERERYSQIDQQMAWILLWKERTATVVNVLACDSCAYIYICVCLVFQSPIEGVLQREVRDEVSLQLDNG